MKCHLTGCRKFATRLVEDDNNKIVFMCKNDSFIFHQNGYSIHKISSLLKACFRCGILLGLSISIIEIIKANNSINAITKVIMILSYTYLFYKGLPIIANGKNLMR